jgi:acyl carrier protein
MENSIMNDTDREIRSFVRSFVAQRSLVPSNEISDELDFFEAGFLDSIGFLELVLATERRFAVSIDFGDVDLEEFSRLAAFAALVGRSRSGLGETA